jgi:hypothetical protein
MRRFVFGILFLAAISLSADVVAAGESGIRGRAAWRGELVPGAVVYAFRDAAGQYRQGHVASSAPTATDGTYSLALPPGSYTLVARTGPDAAAAPPQPGEFYCFYSGSPVVVQEDSWSPVGFNMVKVRPEKRSSGKRSAIEGTVTFKDEPLERLYLYLYREATEGFRGPGIATVPVGSGGRFRMAVSPGSYYVIARKRLRGGMYGPMEIGDYFNYYPGNPVAIGDGEVVTMELETVTRISQLEEGEVKMPTLSGIVLNTGSEPAAGIRVMLYRPEELRGRPVFFSDPTGDDGRFSLPVPVVGRYTVIAREKFGGPATSGERYGQFGSGAAVTVEKGTDKSGMKITVEAKQ